MKTLLMIDGNSLANRAFYGVPGLSNSKNVPTNAVHGFMNMLQSVLKQFEPDELFVAFDISKKVFRHEAYADYKGTRSGMPEDLQTQMPLIRKALEYMNIATVGLEGYEADDIIGTMSRRYAERGDRCIIVSGDRDLFQLVNEFVTVCFPKKGVSNMEIIDPEELKALYDMTPEMVIEMKGLMGDKSDNIPGIAGIGEKTARKLLEEYGSIENLFEHLEDFSGKKIGEKLRAGKEDAILSKQLATIFCEVPINEEELDFSYGNPDYESLLAFYKELELNSLIKQLELPEDIKDESSEEKRLFSGQCIESIEDANAILSQYEPDEIAIIIKEDKNGTIERLSWCYRNESYTVSTKEGYEIVLEALRDMIKHEKTYIITDNAKKMSRALFKAGLSCERIVWDAALASYLIQPESNEQDLGRLALHYLGYELPEENDERAFAELAALQELRPVMQQQMADAGVSSLYRDVELPLVTVLTKMEHEGIKVDVAYLNALKEEFYQQITDISEAVEALAGEPFNLNSPKQLGHILFEVLGLPVVKKTKTGYSTNADVLEALRESHPIIPLILDYRQVSKLQSTYVEGLLHLTDEKDKVHTSFNQTITATGRLSSTGPNLQNIPIRTSEGRRVRQAFIPSAPNRLLVSADYSQIELRILAHLSGDDKLISSFNCGEDIHRRTASEVFHVDLNEVTSAQRRTAKAVNFGIIYGQTDYGLSQELGISRKEAAAYIELYFSRYPMVQAFIQQTIEDARKNGYVTTMLGRRRYIKDINSRNRNLRLFAERTAVNAPIQGTAADIIKVAMLKCEDFLKDKSLEAMMLLQVHDELVFDVGVEDVSTLVKGLKKAMENVIELSVPLKIDIKAGFNWNEMEKL